MEILEIIKKRRSIRDFKEEEIPQEIIKDLIEALIWAPSAGNLQSRKFYFIFDKKIKKKLAKSALNQNFIKKAPLVIVACANLNIENYYGERGKDLYSICDVSASLENALLYLEEKELGACWVGAFDEKKVSETLSLPENLRPIAIIPVGYPAEKPPIPPRVSKEEAVKFIK